MVDLNILLDVARTGHRSTGIPKKFSPALARENTKPSFPAMRSPLSSTAKMSMDVFLSHRAKDKVVACPLA
jgi:hypothetical protein